ncbi:MAG: VWA domain-containing protein [Acidobacteriota bacterium]
MTHFPRRARSLVLLLVGLFLLFNATSSSAQRGRGRVSETERVVEILVPVQVSAKGEAIRSLTKDDFEITDGKKKVDVLGFDIVDLRTIENSQADVPMAARRHFLALFDLTSSDPNSIQRARDAAEDAVLNSLHPADLVGVATFSQQRGLNLVLRFTSDRNQVRAAIRSLGLTAPEEIRPDPLGLVIADVGIDSQSQAESGSNAGGGGGVDAASELQRALSELTTLRGRADRQELTTRLAQSMDGLAQLAQLLDSVQGRKHLLYMSEGFDSRLLFGDGSVESMQRNARASEEGRTQDIDNDDRFGGSDARRIVDRTLEVFRRTNTSIQAIEIGGMVGGRANENLDTLRYMARQTGGEAFANFNNLGDAMGQMLEKTSVTYLLSFAPRDLNDDGEFREIKVKVNGVPRNADISFRKGYFLPKAYTSRQGIEKQLITAQEVIAGQAGGDLDLHAVAPPFIVPGAKAYVPVLLEVSGQSLFENHEGEVMPVEIYGYAIDEQGMVRAYFNRNLGFNVAQAGPVLQEKGVKYWGHFDLDPGVYTLRLFARNSITGSRGLDVVTIDVPEDSETASALLPPLFPETPGQWALAREEPNEQRQVDYPFISKGQPFIPASLPPVPSKGQTKMSLMGYNLGSGSLSAVGLLINDAGETVDGAEIVLDSDASGGAGLAELGATLKTSKVPAGDYTLLVTVKNLANEVEETNSIPIRVIG